MNDHPIPTARIWTYVRERGSQIIFVLVGFALLGLGVVNFWSRPQAFGIIQGLGCIVAGFGSFFLLLTADYLLHHSRLAFVPFCIALILGAIVVPYLAVGLGAALLYMVATQL